MARPRHIPFFRRLRRFLGAEEGAALVEFAIALPTMLLLFAVIIEGSRMMLSYQSAIAGVRDAVRYMSRVVPGDICARGTSVAGYSTQLLSMVRDSRAGTSVFPDAVTVTAVTPSYACVSGTAQPAGAGGVEILFSAGAVPDGAVHFHGRPGADHPLAEGDLVATVPAGTGAGSIVVRFA